MSREAWSLEPYSKQPSHPEQGFDLAYTIPYEWGNLYVSEEARQAYELIPLTADAQPGIPATIGDTPEHLNITVVGPTEASEHLPSQFPFPAEDRVKTHFHRKGVELVLGFNQSTQEVVNGVQTTHDTLVEILRDQGLDIDPSQIVDAEGVPAKESLAQHIPQYFTQHLSHTVAERSMSAMAEWYDVSLNKKAYKKIARTGAMTLALTGIIGASTSTALLVNGEVNTLTVASVGASLVVINGFRKTVKEHFKNQPNRQGISLLLAHNTAMTAAKDIQESFDREVFDKRMSEQLSEE